MALTNRPDKHEEVTCDYCGEKFICANTADEAEAEFEANFPGDTGEDNAVVCDDCYNMMVETMPPPGIETPDPLQWAE